MTALLCLVGCQFLGDFAARVLGLPVPGPIIGMLIMLLGLCLIGHVPDELGRASEVLISQLPLLVIPAGAGIVALPASLTSDLPAISAALMVSTIIALIITGLAARVVPTLNSHLQSFIKRVEAEGATAWTRALPSSRRTRRRRSLSSH